jgi:MFS family permease
VALRHPRAAAHLRRSRTGVFSAFLLAGFAAAVWVVNIPAIQQRTHVSKAVLGIDLLVFGLGSVLSMQIAGHVIDRLGSRLTVLTGSIILIVALALPGLATNAVTLGVALFLLGLGNGSLDLAMNDQAVQVERNYRRPIMSSFHALYSIGGAAGALYGAVTQALGIPVEVIFLIGCVIAAALVVIAVPRLLPRERPGETSVSSAHPDQTDPGTAPSHLGRRVAILAGLAFVLMLAEGVANDWSALQAVEHLNQSHALASLAFGVFALFMTVGRLMADRISHAVGSVSVVRFGSGVAAIGMLSVILSSVDPLTLAGWAVFGLGISGVAPQIFSAAGNLATSGRGVVLSRVVSAGYTGQLVGPAIIGWIASGVGLTVSFGLPLALLLVGVVAAGVIGAPRSR